MVQLLARNWIALALRGGITLALGVFLLIWPELTIRVSLLAFGIYALLDGIFTFIGVRNVTRQDMQWWTRSIRGAVMLGIAVVTLVWPQVTAVLLAYLIAAWAVVTGIFEILAAFELRQQIIGVWLVTIIGALSLAFGFLLLMNPLTGALSQVMLIGTYFLIVGVLWLLLAYQVKRGPRWAR